MQTTLVHRQERRAEMGWGRRNPKGRRSLLAISSSTSPRKPMGDVPHTSRTGDELTDELGVSLSGLTGGYDNECEVSMAILEAV